MEQVLIWPQQYPLLLKGLVEKNGAYILDALESWPACHTSTDESGVSSTLLPPIYYLVWLQAKEPFANCHFQHICEYDEQAHSYIQSVKQHYTQQNHTPEQLSSYLLTQLAPYADLIKQCETNNSFSFSALLYQQRYFQLLTHMLEQGLTLSPADTLQLWQEADYRQQLRHFLPANVAEPDSLYRLCSEKIAQGEDYFTLLQLLFPQKNLHGLLEHALLANLQQTQPKQSQAMRFVEQGAKGNVPDEQGKTAFMWAISCGFVNLVEALLPNQDLNAQDNVGNTALHYCVLAANNNCLTLLLKAGADHHITNQQGLTCYRLAEEKQQRHLIKNLEQNFNIKELSPEKKQWRITQAHSLYALVAWLLPLQLFLFLNEQNTIKSTLVYSLAVCSTLLFFVAWRMKRSRFYPHKASHFSLLLVRVLAGVSLLAQWGLTAIVLLAMGNG